MRNKTESHTTEAYEQSLPFFARFLEGQNTSTNDAIRTLKFPSDSDEHYDYMPVNNGPQE